MKAHLVDVFTTEAGKGNPGAVVVASGLSGAEMGGIAARLGMETTFVDGTTLRYYQPEGNPMTLCGHGTLAALSVMGLTGKFTVSTPAGDLEVAVEEHRLGMAMPSVTFSDPVDPKVASEALGVDLDDMLTPVQACGAGRPKLMVPVETTEILDSIMPDPGKIAAACAATGTTGLYPFTLKPRGFGVIAEARQFPSGGGIVEDPVTGVAAVALAWYLWKHGVAPGCGSLHIEQGYAMGRPGHVMVKQEPDGHTWIFGNTVLAGTTEV